MPLLHVFKVWVVLFRVTPQSQVPVGSSGPRMQADKLRYKPYRGHDAIETKRDHDSYGSTNVAG